MHKKTLIFITLQAALWLPAAMKAQDSPIILQDNSTMPDKHGKDKDKRKPDKKGSNTTLSPTFKMRASKASSTPSYFTQGSSNDFYTAGAGYVPVCLELKGTKQKCSSPLTCIGPNQVDLYQSGSVTSWNIDARNGWSLFWTSGTPNKVELQTGGSTITTTGTSPSITSISDAYDSFLNADVTVAGQTKTFTSKNPGMEFDVHYCQLDGSGKPNCMSNACK